MSRKLFSASAVVGGPLLARYMKETSMKVEPSEADGDEGRKAICVLNSDGHKDNPTANGVVWFDQPHFYAKCKVSAEFEGLTPGLHGFHIH